MWHMRNGNNVMEYVKPGEQIRMIILICSPGLTYSITLFPNLKMFCNRNWFPGSSGRIIAYRSDKIKMSLVTNK